MSRATGLFIAKHNMYNYAQEFFEVYRSQYNSLYSARTHTVKTVGRPDMKKGGVCRLNSGR